MDDSLEPTKAQSSKGFYQDMSLWSLVGSNLIAVIWAFIEHWSLAMVMWVYWGQSVIIGVLWFFKILSLKEYSTEGFTINDRAVKPTKETKIQTAVFFIIHYGFFHVLYFSFLIGMFETIELVPVVIMAGIFLIYQCYSFSYNRKWLQKRKPNIGTMMFFPYARIIPMHLTIIIGGGLLKIRGGASGESLVLLIFMLLKTLADAIMHIIEQKGFSDPAQKRRVT